VSDKMKFTFYVQREFRSHVILLGLISLIFSYLSLEYKYYSGSIAALLLGLGLLILAIMSIRKDFRKYK